LAALLMLINVNNLVESFYVFPVALLLQIVRIHYVSHSFFKSIILFSFMAARLSTLPPADAAQEIIVPFMRSSDVMVTLVKLQ